MSETSVRKCSKCKTEHRRNHPYCSDCQREYNRRWRALNPEKAAAWVKSWKDRHPERTSELNRASCRKMYWEDPEKIRARKLKDYYENKDKWLARAAAKPHYVKKAGWRIRELVRSGRLIRPDSCSSCGVSGVPIEFHHPDHSLPEVVEALCRKCHGATRRKERTA